MTSRLTVALLAATACYCGGWRPASVRCSPTVATVALEAVARTLNACRGGSAGSSPTSMVGCVKRRWLAVVDGAYRSRAELRLVPHWISLVPVDDAAHPAGAAERGADSASSQEAGTVEDGGDGATNASLDVDGLIVGRVVRFLQSRAISVKIPIIALDVFDVLGTGDEEEGRGRRGGRGKKDKGANMLVMGGLFAGTMMAMKLAVVAAMAGKALMASLMATLLAVLAALGKKGSAHGSSYEVINVPHGHHGRGSEVESNYANQKYYGGESTYGEQLEMDPN